VAPTSLLESPCFDSSGPSLPSPRSPCSSPDPHPRRCSCATPPACPPAPSEPRRTWTSATWTATATGTCILADGGDTGNQQNRIWINQGGAQGGTLGSFVDQTSTRFPIFLDDSRDIEFADIDKDGDLDICTSACTSRSSDQSSRWLANMGGVQGGSPGFYQDQSATRWVNLGVNNGTTTFSSINGSLILGGGSGFVDWSCDCDFGDIDNDGDLDLVHSTYGGAFGGDVPTRMFLNDGVGKFEEFNPSHFQLPGSTIANGNPGLWAMGTQSASTTNSTGVNCDVASSALDIDFGDIDGDLDLDLLHGAREQLPRMFQNRFAENGNVLVAFRDTTGIAFPAGYSTGNGHYEQEMGDLDADGDLDIYGLNWLVGGGGLVDITLENTGNGTYTNLVSMSGSGTDDNEADFFDYDMDGDLDAFIAAFASDNRLYRNNWTGGGFSYTNVTAGNVPGNNPVALDADCCDVDEDGDTDVVVANDNNSAEWYLQNTTTGNDVFAPLIKNLEQAPNRSAGAAPTLIRAHVYDNAPYYITWYNPTTLEYSVNGGAFTSVVMLSSAGQIFRGEIPGALVGTIDYRVRSADKYGNSGVSVTKTYTATGGGCTGTPVTYCTAKVNSLGCTPSIGFTGIPSASVPLGFTVSASNVINNKPGLLIYTNGGQRDGALRGGPALHQHADPALDPAVLGRQSSAERLLGRVLDRHERLWSGCSRRHAGDIPGRSRAPWWTASSGAATTASPRPNNATLSNGLEYTICP
jgi:hypothetical protein